MAALSTGGLERRARPKSRGVAWGELYCVRPAVCREKVLATRHSHGRVCVCFSIITITSMRVFDMSICICDLREAVCGHGVRHEF